MKMALFGHEDAADCMLNVLLQQVPVFSQHVQWAEKYIPGYSSYAFTAICSIPVPLLTRVVQSRQKAGI